MYGQAQRILSITHFAYQHKRGEKMETKKWNQEIICPNCKWKERIQQFVTLNDNECINCGYVFATEYKMEEQKNG